MSNVTRQSNSPASRSKEMITAEVIAAVQTAAFWDISWKNRTYRRHSHACDQRLRTRFALRMLWP
jgi:hypothetical protein